MATGDPDGLELFDVFLCYSWDDKELVDQLYDELEALGLAVFKDDVSVDDWGEMLPSIRRAILGSRLLVPVITPRFYESEHCRTELHLALLRSYWLDRGRLARIRPVLWQIEPRAVRPRVLKHHKFPKAGKSAAELARLIADAVAEVGAADPRRFGDAPEVPRPDWFPVPMVTRPRFTGRSDELWELHEALLADEKPRDRGHPVVSVRGVGGQGKSTLVAQYARWFAEDHPGGVFVIELSGSDRRLRSDSDAIRRRFDRGLDRIAEALEIDEQEQRRLGVRVALARTLRRRGPYLWIVDGVPSQVEAELVPELHAPTAAGKTVFTTRGRLREMVSEEIELGSLRPRDGLALLTVECRPDGLPEVQAARQIVAELDAHPLGLRLAAGQTMAVGFAGYRALLGELRRTDREILELTADLRQVLPTGYARAFSATVLRSHRSLTDAGRDVLDAAGVLAAERIPRSLLVDILADGHDGDRAATTLDEGLARLWEFGLAERGDGGLENAPEISVHALVGRAVRVLSPHARRRRQRDSAIRTLTDLVVAPRRSIADDRRIGRCLPHVDAAVGPLDADNEWPVGPDEWHLLNEAARVEYEIGDSRRSLAHFRSLATACGTTADCDEWTRRRIRANLGAAYANYREYDTARQILEEVLAELDAAGPAYDLEGVARVTEVLGNCRHALGHRDKALVLLKQAYRTRRECDGPTDPATLTALNNLVITMGAGAEAGAHRLALRWGLGSWALWYRTAGPDAGGTLDSLASVGANLVRLNDIEAACDVLEYVWRRRRAVQGDLHPDTIGAGENLVRARERRAGGQA